MALSGVIPALEAAARAEAAALVRAAQAQAESIAAEGERRRSALRARAQADADTTFAAALDDAVRSARHEAAAQTLRARALFLDEVRGKAAALLPRALESGRYRAQLAKQLADALGYLREEGAAIRCAPILVEPLGALAGGARVEADPAISDGFEVVSRDGSLCIDARLSTELLRRWPALSVELARRAAP